MYGPDHSLCSLRKKERKGLLWRGGSTGGSGQLEGGFGSWTGRVIIVDPPAAAESWWKRKEKPAVLQGEPSGE